MHLTLAPIAADAPELAAIYSDPYVARVGYDDRPAQPIAHEAVSYHLAHIDGETVGAFMAIRSGYLEWDVHALLTRHALPYCRELGRLFLDWCFSHPIARVTAPVIEGLESARNYCLRLGFHVEGFRRDVLRQGGVLRGVWVLGMTRTDWEAAR